jgi:predicted mannosyl-3-phosphoglycerate phosphatase (HAD superfamily)
MYRRTKVIYIATDSLFSQRGAVLHGFDQFLAQLARAQIPCVWITALTRAQVDEPRRRLGQGDPYIGENGCGVYLPEDYFHLKGSNTIRLGRYTCIPMAKPQPAAAEALEELAADLDIAVVPLRKLSPRELSQNTGLPAREAELIRQRDFDELFFFAGATEADIEKFRQGAESRDLRLRRNAQFWSLSCGADLAKCVRELGGLYDRSLRGHALRVGLYVTSGGDTATADRGPRRQSAFDKTLTLTEHPDRAQKQEKLTQEELAEDYDSRESLLRNSEEIAGGKGDTLFRNAGAPHKNHFYLHSPQVWDDVLAVIGADGTRR